MSYAAIVDYDMGNTDSVLRAVEECGGHSVLTKKKTDFEEASHIILPGVGAFKKGMEQINCLDIKPILEEQVLKQKIHFLGICLGMQLLATRGFENGETEGLGWIEGDVIRFEKTQNNERIPHIGWNEIKIIENNPLFSGINSSSDFYFVHSYHFICKNQSNVIARTPYCGEFVSAVNQENIYGVQFHPEKSQTIGFSVLRNFLAL